MRGCFLGDMLKRDEGGLASWVHHVLKRNTQEVYSAASNTWDILWFNNGIKMLDTSDLDESVSHEWANELSLDYIFMLILVEYRNNLWQKFPKGRVLRSKKKNVGWAQSFKATYLDNFLKFNIQFCLLRKLPFLHSAKKCLTHSDSFIWQYTTILICLSW